MKTKFFIILVIFLSIFQLKAETKKTISVKNVDEFLKAIGNDVTIRILVERLDFSNFPTNINNANTELISKDNAFCLQIKNIKNLKIIGQKKGTKIISNHKNIYLLSFKEVENITIENLEAGQVSRESGVFLFENAKNISLKNCILFGGSEGLALKKVTDFRFENSIIRGTNQRILSIQNGNNIDFTKSRFTDNQALDLFYIIDSQHITFQKCVIDLNKSGRGESYDNYALFHVPMDAGNFTEIVILKECKIEDNFVQYFCRVKDIIKVEKCTMENNVFERGYQSVDF
ncbi:MAG: hypothetical protein EAZ85_13340 [Bacteroidetes bacterium]|nr:MAG: hypothetical protein EAZ85_13340 [Bacteroidota bacterium]TAG92091.1 MAG: hypothetical protein EAZ20_02820 [Bacteroidota bacterium]